MKKLFVQFLTLFLLASFFHACNDTLVEEQFADDIELKSAQTGKISYIVVLNDDELNSELSNLKGYEKRQQAAQKAAEKVMKRAGVTDGELGFVYGTAIKGFSVKIPPGQLKKLENDPSVKYIEENQIITLIEPKAKPGNNDVQAYAETVPWGIARVNGGETYTGTKKAWIIDTGIDLDHPDLNVNTNLSKTFVPRTSSANDDNGHGSHVAGTVAAKKDGVGVVGVAAGAQLVAIKVLDRRGSGSWEGVIAGIDYVADAAAAGDVANMSLGGSFSQTINDAVIAAAEKKIKFALAAGNESTDAATKSPASAEHTNIYTISAMAQGDLWASYSNYGNPPVDYCAPGSGIYSTYKDGGYATLSGTSMAAPHMAGILLWGAPVTDGTVKNDPDGKPDPIGVVDNNGTTPTNNPPTANFTYSATNLTVNFTDTSTDSDGTIQSRSWNFGDGSSSTLQNPTKTYASAGTYTVTLTVTDDDGATASKSQNITVTDGGTTNNPPSAGFSFTTNDLTATFTDQSSDDDGSVVGWNWNFGDGSTSTTQNTSHTYFTGGTYTVTLTVTDDDGATDTTSKSVTVSTNQTSDISLTATLRKVRGVRYVDFVWNGATGTQVNIKMNGAVQKTVSNDGSETIDFGRLSGTFVFQVCETNDSACSNEVTLAL